MKKLCPIISTCIFVIVFISLGICTQRAHVRERADAILPKLEEMTLREKVGQMFCIRPEHVDHTWPITELTDSFMLKIKDYPVGGILISGYNYSDTANIRVLNEQIHAMYGYPFISIDEEGGRVVSLAHIDSLNLPRWETTWEIGQTHNPKKAYECGRIIGRYLKDYGLDVTFAPVADVWTNPDNIVAKRCYSDNGEEAAEMCWQFTRGLHKEGILGSYKHFPGHGNTAEDSHYSAALTYKTWDELKECELLPYYDGIAHGIQMIMVSHVALPNVTGDTIPTSLSYYLMTEKLRNEMGFEGVIITDSYGMKAVSAGRTAAEEALQGVQAGVDIVLGPINYFEAFDAIVEAVEKGDISEERINESVERVLAFKRWLLTHNGCR